MRILLWFFGLAISGVIVTGIAAFAVLFHFWIFLSSPANSSQETIRVSVKQGMTAHGVAQLLEKQGVITDARKFYLFCRVHKAGQKLQAGDYAFSSSLTPAQILERINQGKVLQYRVTFPEGSSLWDVAKILEQKGLGSGKKIIEKASSPSFIQSLGFDLPSLEGYLFPETYLFKPSQNEASILETMVRQFQLNFPEEWKKRTEEIGLTVHQVVILASLVESEARVDSERPLIAAVFLNRLKRDMPLQSDPTAVYDLPDFSGPVMKEHLKRQTPYNTYQKKGLPIGPICNPGIKSIEAVLYSQEVPYLYFVSNNDGTHRFSETLGDHNRAVRDYRQKIRVQTETH